MSPNDEETTQEETAAPAAPVPPAPPASPEPAPEQDPLVSRVHEAPPSVDAQDLPIDQHAKVLAAEQQGKISGQQADKEEETRIENSLQSLQDVRDEHSQWAAVNALQEHVDQQQGAAKQMQSDLQDSALQYRQAVDNFKAINPNPWADRGTGYTIGAAIATALGQFGASLTGTANPATQILDNALHRDLQAQQLAFEKARGGVEAANTMYGQMRQIYQDKNAAMAASWAASKELVAARAKAQLMALNPAMRTLQAQKQIAQFDADALEASRKAADIAFTQRVQAQKVGDSERAQSQLQKYRDVLQKGHQSSANMFQEEGVKGKQLDQADMLYSTYVGTFRDSSRIAAAYFNLPVAEQADPQNFMQFRQAMTSLSQTAKQLRGQGMRFSEKLQEIDEQLSSGSLGTPGSKVFLDNITGGAIKGAFQSANKQMANDFREQLLTITGKSADYWIGKQQSKLQSENEASRYRAGVGGEVGQPDTSESAPAE